MTPIRAWAPSLHTREVAGSIPAELTVDTARYCGAVSQENVEIVRRVLGAYAGGDIEEMLIYVDPESELHSAIIGGAEGNVYRGHDGFRKWFAESQAAFVELRTELTEFRDLGDRVVGLGRVHARGRESDVELDSRTGWVFALRRGKVVKAEGFLSHAEALEAAGVQE